MEPVKHIAPATNATGAMCKCFSHLRPHTVPPWRTTGWHLPEGRILDT